MTNLRDAAHTLEICLVFHARWASTLVHSGQCSTTQARLLATTSSAVELAARLSTEWDSGQMIDQMKAFELELCAQSCLSYLEELQFLACIGDIAHSDMSSKHFAAQVDLQSLILDVSALKDNFERAASERLMLDSCSVSANQAFAATQRHTGALTPTP
jgi:hypothetical protein